MAKEKDAMTGSSAVELDAQGASSTPAIESGADYDVSPTPEGQKEADASKDGDIRTDASLENQIREWKRKAEEAQASAAQKDRMLYDMMLRAQSQAGPMTPAVGYGGYPQGYQGQSGIPQGQAAYSRYLEEQAGIDQEGQNVFRQMAREEAERLVSALQNQTVEERNRDIMNENLLDQMLMRDENKHVRQFRNEALQMLRGQSPQYKMQGPIAVEGVLNNLWGIHRSDIMQSMRSEVERQAGRDQRTISESVTGTTVTTDDGATTKLTAAQRREYEKLVDDLNRGLSDTDRGDPSKLWSIEKLVKAQNRHKEFLSGQR